MAYKVIKAFTDGQDSTKHIYGVGDDYPRKGYSPSKERIEGLLGTDNKQGVPLIKRVEKPAKVEIKKEEPKESKPRKERRKKG